MKLKVIKNNFEIRKFNLQTVNTQNEKNTHYSIKEKDALQT